MARTIHGAHEPLIHISKREDCGFLRACGVRLAAIALALVVCGGVIIALTGRNPVEVYAGVIDGAVGSSRRLWVTIRDTLSLLLVAVALTPAFKMRFWNVGGEGQVLIGATATAAVMINFADKLPAPALFAAMLCAGVLAGMIWGVIPALFKAGWNTNETLFTLMMNYVATQLVAYFIIIWESPRGSGKIGIINQQTQAGWLPQIGEYKYLLTVVVAAALTVFLHIYMTKSKHGYELAVVGESERTARYIGIKVGRVFIRTMLLSGAICGIAGLLMVGSTDHTMTTTLAGGRGFTAVMVAWMAKFNPIGMIFTSFLLAFLGKGAGEVATQFGLNQSFSDILSSIIIFFLIGCEFFIQYRIVFRKEAK